jgi:hypothetical protein
MVWYGMVWYGMVWYGMVWYGMVWYGMVWYGMVWYGMVWYGMGTIKPKKLSNTIPAYKIGARKWLHPSASLEAPTKIFSKFEPNISLSNFYSNLTRYV